MEFRGKRMLCVLCLAWCVQCFFAAAPLVQAKTVRSWDYYLKQLKRYAKEVGIQVTSADGQHVLWQYNASIPIIPASLLKVLTSYTALKVLGPDFRFKTEIYANRLPNKGVIAGDVWIKGGGDPYFLARDAWQLAWELKREGVREIRGKLYVDNTLFKPSVEHICIDRRCQCSYNPVVSATALEFNTLTFSVFPKTDKKRSCRIFWMPPTDYVSVDNQMKTSAKRTRTNVRIQSLGINKNHRERFRISGVLGQKVRSGYTGHVNVAAPVWFYLGTFRHLLRQAGVMVDGGLGGEKPVPAQAKALVTHESRPLSDILFGLNRYSNNFMAEMILRVVGAKYGGAPGTVGKGIDAMRNTLASLGVSRREIIVDCGSGLSRQTRVSPRCFNAVLGDIYKDFQIGPEFLSSLAKNGHDGTLKKRLRNLRNKVRIRGKTGTLSGVIAFAGYVSRDSRNPLIVTVMLNRLKNPWEAKRALDNFMAAIPRLAETPAPRIRHAAGKTP